MMGKKRQLYNPITQNVIQNTARNRKSVIRQIENYRKNKLVLIACSKTKAFLGDEKLRAENAYCSRLFQKSRRWAELRGMDWAVISAKHGIIWPHEKIEDYDLMFGELTPNEKQKWAEKAAHDIHKWRLRRGDFRERWTPPKGKVIVFAGKAYTEPLRRGLKHFQMSRNETGIEVEEPLEGLQIGERLRELDKTTGVLDG